MQVATKIRKAEIPVTQESQADLVMKKFMGVKWCCIPNDKSFVMLIRLFCFCE